jgi:YARHG domain
MKSPLILAFAAAASFALTLVPAQAGDVQGDAFDCQELWVMRNQMYKDAGYCFSTTRGITYFGNGGCSTSNHADLVLSGQDQQTLRAVKKSEARQGCS